MAAVTVRPPSTVPPVTASRPFYIPGLDFVRIVALAGIIGTHAVAWAGRDTAEAASWYLALDLLTRAGVPCFLVLNGILFGYGQRTRRESPLQFLRKRWFRIGIPWLFWTAVYVVVQMGLIETFVKRRDPPGPLDVLFGVLQGPGYLYFLLLLGQFTIISAWYPSGQAARNRLAVVCVIFQLALNQVRLWLPEGFGGDVWYTISDQGYVLSPFWIGDFALGVAIGGYLYRLRQATPGRVMAALVCCSLSAAGLVLAPEFGWWHGELLQGADSLLHPLYLPLSCSAVLLIFWLGQALSGAYPAVLPTVALVSEASFGIYLVQQYPLELLGPVAQQMGGLLDISRPLPQSLPAVFVLYLLTIVSAAGIVWLLRRQPWGTAVLGGTTTVREQVKPAAGPGR